MREWIAGAIGFAAVVVTCFMYLRKTRSSILITKLMTDALWILNYALLGGYSGALVSTIAFIRDCVFFQRGRRKWADHRAWLFVFLSLTMITPAIEWQMKGQFSLLPLLPTLGSMLTVVSCFVLKTYSMRVYGFAGQLPWIYYNIVLRNYAGLDSNAVVITTALLGNWRERREMNKQTA